jgi:LysM repeat protein
MSSQHDTALRHDAERKSEMTTVAISQFGPGPVRRSHLRMTRRGQIVLGFLIAIVLCVGALFIAVNGGGAAASGETGSQTTFSHVTVMPGQSLWQIAEKVAPNADPRVVVAAISDLNQLQDSTVSPGQQLAIPSQYAH